jgi:preprotein translocase subunit YajC
MFISQAHAQTANSAPAGGEWFVPAIMIGLLIFMYFTTIRPQRKRQKEHAELVSSLSKGDEVLMSSGLMGKVMDLSDLYVVVNVSDRVDLKFQRTHVTATLPKGTIKTLGA